MFNPFGTDAEYREDLEREKASQDKLLKKLDRTLKALEQENIDLN